MVLSDAAMHAPCMVMAFRWCPYLIEHADEVEAVQVDFSAIVAGDDRLDMIVDYGDEVRSWVVPNP